MPADLQNAHRLGSAMLCIPVSFLLMGVFTNFAGAQDTVAAADLKVIELSVVPMLRSVNEDQTFAAVAGPLWKKPLDSGSHALQRQAVLVNRHPPIREPCSNQTISGSTDELPVQRRGARTSAGR